MKWIFITLAVILTLAQFRDQLTGLSSVTGLQAGVVPQRAATDQPSVLMYATQQCPYCRKARRWMVENGIQWEERDIDKSPQANREMRALGGNGVPTFLIGGSEVVVGYNSSALRELLLP